MKRIMRERCRTLLEDLSTHAKFGASSRSIPSVSAHIKQCYSAIADCGSFCPAILQGAFLCNCSVTNAKTHRDHWLNTDSLRLPRVSPTLPQRARPSHTTKLQSASEPNRVLAPLSAAGDHVPS